MSTTLGAIAPTPGAGSNAAVAIIDTADDTRPWLGQLKARQIAAVIRYLSRGWRSDLPNQRIAGNGPGDPCGDGHFFPGSGGSEAAQLLNGGFGIVLVYEYKSSLASKFLFGIDSSGNANSGLPGTDHVAAAQAEADADIAAAKLQTAAIGLPNAPVYFTVDFDLEDGAGNSGSQYSDGTPISNHTVVTAVNAYFQRLQQTLGKARLGVYGNGLTNQNMIANNYVTYSWVSQSASFANTAEYLSTGPWNLFQQMDWYWFGSGKCPSGLDVDTDIQNPSVSDIGAVTANGPFLIDAARTQAIFNARYVAVPPPKHTVPILTAKLATAPAISTSFCDTGTNTLKVIDGIGRNVSVRILDDDGTWVTVDINEDGVAEGYALKAGNFVTSIKDTPPYYPGPTEATTT
jgi:glycoside hydrolase-like protein